MGQAIPQAQKNGIPIEVIAASLANSIAKNYISKVVGSRKLGNKVILTGAVFYNKAVVAAFNQQLPDRDLIIAEHREISGAIGAALLTIENKNIKNSNFRGFKTVINTKCDLSSFTCSGCDNNCNITKSYERYVEKRIWKPRRRVPICCGYYLYSIYHSYMLICRPFNII